MSSAPHQLPYASFRIRPWYQSPIFVLGLLTTIATLPLIFMGGLVTSNGAGLAVPDWPNSYGYNMFLFPPRYWVGGIFYEHTHRLMGTLVGFLSTLLCVAAFLAQPPQWTQRLADRAGVLPKLARFAAWVAEPRRWVRRLCYWVFFAVLFQGVLGGLRVVFKNLDLAIVHACVAQAFFCLAATVIVVASNWWHSAPNLSGDASRPLLRVAITAVAVIYLQLVVGATMRHEQAGLAIPDFPLNFGHILPPAPSAVNDAFRTAAMHNWPDPALTLLAHVTAWQIYLQFAHRIGAVIATIAVCWLVRLIYRNPGRQHLLRLANVLLFLLVTQITLGILSVLWRKPADIASLHVATGALTLVTTYIIALRAARLFRPAPPAHTSTTATSRVSISSAPLPVSSAPPLS